MAKKTKTKKKTSKFKLIALLICAVMLASLFLSVSLIFLIGMMPTIVSYAVDKKGLRSRIVTVGSMNLAGCTPFVIELLQHDYIMSKSIEIVTTPLNIVVMYSAAAIGYAISWGMSGIISGILYQKGQARQKAIHKRQDELIERWGQKVTGKIPLDEQGFPVES